MATSSLTFWAAATLARAGAKIRREGWVDRWWKYDRCLFWLIPYNAITKVEGKSRVLLASDVTRAEFEKSDWTTDAYVPPATTVPTTPSGTLTVSTAGVVGGSSTSVSSTTSTEQIRVGWDLGNWAGDVARGTATVDQTTGILTWYWFGQDASGKITWIGAVRSHAQLKAIYA